MIRRFILLFIITCSLLFFIFLYGKNNSIQAFSAEISTKELEVYTKKMCETLGPLEIENVEFLYGFNDSPDFVYFDFKTNGYAIFFKETFELMEYSYQNNLNFSKEKKRKYYAGPSNYYEKEGNSYISIITGTELIIKNEDAKNYSLQLYDLFNKNVHQREEIMINVKQKNDKSLLNNINEDYINRNCSKTIPSFDEENMIDASPPGSVDTVYINNYNYFFLNPLHGENVHGTCGSVATQLLLSYNNYYNDRRIISPEYLNGGWKTINNGDIFDRTNYYFPERDPNVTSNPNNANSQLLGSNNDYYDEIISIIEPSGLPANCVHTIGPNGEIIHSHNGSSYGDVCYGLEDILNLELDDSDYTINSDTKIWFFGWSPISSIPIKNEINNNRPLIIGMNQNLASINHWAVGYGYQNYTYPEGGTYSGYIVHMGWDSDSNNIWINESWCDSYIALTMNHTHNYSQTFNIINNEDIEMRCTICNHRTTEDIYDYVNNTITGFNHLITGDIIIPDSINGNTITAISSNAFCGFTSIESITIPSTLTNIGSNAFYGCTSLEEVVINRSEKPITSLGLNAFDNCASNLTIIVPVNRVCEYKNTPFWSSYRDKIVPSSPIIDDIDLDCMVDDDVTTYLYAGYNKLYRLDVECDGWYTISCTSGTHYSIYNSNMVKIAGAYDTYELTLNEGTYYIDIEWEDPTDSGNATLHFLNKGINVSDNITNNILPHLHNVGTNYKAQLKYYNNQGAGYYKFSLTATSSNSNPVEYILGAITMYTAFDRNNEMNKYSDDKYTLSAKSLAGENSMVVYLPSNGYYYFDVKMNTNSLSSLVLNITPYISSNIDLFDCSVSSNHDINIINTNVEGDYFQKKVLKQKGKFKISFTYTDPDPNNISSSDVVVVVTKVTYNANTNTYSFTKVYSANFCEVDVLFTSYIFEDSKELDAGTYYIGYFNNKDCANIKVDFERKITQYGSYNLISDPDANEDYGSEVRFNNGSYLGSTLTVGFTRFIYLNYDYILPSYSRLDYYFYSSNENIATISEYGTLLGKSAGTVKIMAVYKNDPSITFVKQFTVLADNRINNLIIYDTDSIDYTGSGQIYQIELDDYNSYFPQISLYNWSLISSSNNYSYSISEWGTFSLYGEDIIVIEGTSQLNSKLKIRITLTIM